MADKAITLTLNELEKENVPALQSIRLAEAGKGVMLFASTMTEGQGFPQYQMLLTASPLDETTKPGKDVFSIPQLLPAPARWDIILTKNNQYQCLAEKAGGAINSLFLLDASGNQQSLTEQYLMESFSLPRFIKQKPLDTPSFVTAVLDSEQLILLPVQQGADKSASVMLGDYVSGVLVKTSTGYALFAKKVESGEARYDEMPGTLELVRLDEQFEIMGVATQPFSGEMIYEFDVDILPSAKGRDRFTLFAIGSDKPLLAVSDQNVFDFIPVEGEFTGKKMARPAIVATEAGDIYVAVVEELHAEDARLLSGSVAISR